VLDPGLLLVQMHTLLGLDTQRTLQLFPHPLHLCLGNLHEHPNVSEAQERAKRVVAIGSLM
jgi:hypothetical protein